MKLFEVGDQLAEEESTSLIQSLEAMYQAQGMKPSEAKFAASQSYNKPAGSSSESIRQEFGGLKEPAVPVEDFLSLGLSMPLKKGLIKGGQYLAKKGAAKAGAETARIGALQAQMAIGNAGYDIGMGAARTGISDQWQEENPWKMLGVELLAGIPTGAAAERLMRPGVAKKAIEPFADFATSEAGRVDVSVPLVSQKVSNLWDQAVGQRVSALANKLGQIPVVPKDGRVAKTLGGNTFNEMFTSPLDRMDKLASNKIEDVMVESARASEAFKAVSGKMQELPLEARDELRKVLKTNMNLDAASPEYRSLIADILAPFDQALGHAKSKILTTAQKDELYNVEMSKRLTSLFSEDADDPILGILKSQTKHDLNTAKGTRAFLKEVISSPLIPQSSRNLAIDLHDLGAKTVTEVASSYKNSLESVLLGDIVNNPAWVKHPSDFADELARVHGTDLNRIMQMTKAEKTVVEKELASFTRMPRHPVFGDLLVKKDIADGLRDLDTTNTTARNLWNTYFLNPWKMMKVVMNPAARVRDLFSNAMFADIAGKHSLSPYNLKPYMQALKEAKNNGPLRREFEHYTGMALGNWADIASPAISKAAKHNAGIPEIMLSALYNNKMSKGMSNITQFTDQWVKLAKFIHNKHMGMEGREAAFDALAAIGDFNRQTKSVKLVRDTMMPFFGWQVHAIKSVAGGMAHRPLATMKYFAMPIMASMYAVDNLNLNEDDWQQIKESLPDYMKDTVMGVPTHIPLPFRDEQGRIQMFDAGYWLPGLQDLAELGRNASNPTSLLQNPAISLYSALKSNQKFSGAPIWYEWEEPSTKAAKAFSYIGQQLLPNWTPGIGTAYEKLATSFDDELGPTTANTGQAIVSALGLKVSPVDEDQLVANKHKLLKMYESEAKTQLRRELSKTNDSDKQDAISDKYSKIFEKLYQEISPSEE